MIQVQWISTRTSTWYLYGENYQTHILRINGGGKLTGTSSLTPIARVQYATKLVVQVNDANTTFETKLFTLSRVSYYKRPTRA